MNITIILTSSIQRLKNSVTPKLDAEILLTHIIKQPRSYLYAHPEYKLTTSQLRRFNQLLSRREAGEPVAYLLGQCEFWSLTLHVNHDVLIPRPDTELLVTTALQLFTAEQKIAVADLGTGSGAVALAIASERPCWKIIATDISPKALKIAAKNRKNLGLKNTCFKLDNWCNSLKNNYFNMIISNPPYIAKNDEHLQQLKFEPISALVAEDNGLCDCRAIIPQAKSKLKVNGYLLLEHGHQQAFAVQKIFLENGYTNIQTYRDYSGNERVTIGARSEE